MEQGTRRADFDAGIGLRWKGNAMLSTSRFWARPNFPLLFQTTILYRLQVCV